MENWEVNQYSKLINKVLQKGEKRQTRAGEAYSIFGETITIDISKEFPLLKGRKMFYKPVLGELAAMLRGPKNVKDFQDMGCNYWNSWGSGKTEEALLDTTIGTLNLDYGNAWLDFNGVNQLEQLINTLKTNPTDRRMLISGWRPDRLNDLSLPCCHMLYQWYVRDGKHLDMLWYQRSVDTMVGLPSDIILCAAWNIIIASQCGFTPGTIKLILGDTHIYANHVAQVLDYMRGLNKAMEEKNDPLAYTLQSDATVTNFMPNMLTIEAYNPQPAIHFKLNV